MFSQIRHSQKSAQTDQGSDGCLKAAALFSNLRAIIYATNSHLGTQISKVRNIPAEDLE